MTGFPAHYADGAEALVVGLARTGDEAAFTELVRRRQSWIRGLMRRLCGEAALADDLAQKAFLQAWRKLPGLEHPERFGPWLKQLAVNTWRQHARRNDPMRNADDTGEPEDSSRAPAGMAMDLDRALAQLSPDARMCIVLSYSEGMTHPEIATATGLPAGTVKSHIRRGTQRLQGLLADYDERIETEERQ